MCYVDILIFLKKVYLFFKNLAHAAFLKITKQRM